jgi:inner membrane transporter RhtA
MLKPIIFLLIAMCSIQFGATIAKGLFPALGPAGTSSLRIYFASIMLLVVFRPWRFKLNPSQKKFILIYGTSLGLMNLLFYAALERIPLGIAVALEFTGPLAISILTSKRKVDFLWIVLAATGIYLLLPSSTEASLDLLGIALALGAGFFWALYILFGKKAGKDIPGEVASSLGMTVAALVVMPLGFYVTGLKLLDTSLWPLGILVGLLSSALPYTLEMFALKKIPTKTFGVLMSLEPAIATFAGLLFLSEALSLAQSFAIACIMISSLGSTMTSRES